MRKWPTRLAGTSLVLGALFVASSLASAATCTLKPKLMKSSTSYARPPSTDWLFHHTLPQHIQMPVVGRTVVEDGKPRTVFEDRKDDPMLKQFAEIVKKQPETYNAERPFRGVVTLGDKKYGFVLDALKPKASGYSLLYFDRNGNGDLTDDGVIKSNQVKQYKKLMRQIAKEKAAIEKAEKEKARKQKTEKGDTEEEAAAAKEEADKAKKAEAKRLQQQKQRRATARRLLANARFINFPRVDMEIEVEGKKTDYAFFFMAYCYPFSAFARLNSAVYYEGELDLDGRAHRVVLVDYNSNGRFDDETTLADVPRAAEQAQQIRPNPGDCLYVDPKPTMNYLLAYDATGFDFRHYVAKLLCLDDRYYDLEVAPTGKRLTLEPSDVAVGYVKNPNKNYAAVVHGDQGIVKIKGTAERPVALPVGQWTLLSYRIDLTEVNSDEKAEEKQDEKNADAKQRTKPPRRPPAPKYTFTSASATTATKPVDVGQGQTAELRFGPPYRATVEPGYYRKDQDMLYLGLRIAGAADEIVTNMSINNKRPEKPTFKITDPDGEVVLKGNFEYG